MRNILNFETQISMEQGIEEILWTLRHVVLSRTRLAKDIVITLPSGEIEDSQCTMNSTGLYIESDGSKKKARFHLTDKIKSPVHLSIGQEAVAVVCQALRPEDTVLALIEGMRSTWPRAAI